MVPVSEQMSLDLKRAQLGLQNNANRISGTGSSSNHIAVPSKLPELCTNRKSTISMQSSSSRNVQGNASTAIGSGGFGGVGSSKSGKNGQMIKDSQSGANSRRPIQKLTSVSFEDEDSDLELTRAGFELYDAIRKQRFG